MAGPYLGAVPIPPGDPSGLASSGRTYAALANSARTSANQLSNQATTVDWQGSGADAYRAKVESKATAYHRIQAAMELGSVVYMTYSHDLAHAQAVARQAQGITDEANSTASSMLQAQGTANQAASQAQAANQALPQAITAAAAPNAPASAQTAVQQAVTQSDQASLSAYQAAAHAQALSDTYSSQAGRAQSLAAEAEGLATAAAAKATGGFGRVAGMVAALVNGKDHGGLAETMDKLNTKLGYGLSPWALLTAPPALWAAARYRGALSDFRTAPARIAGMSTRLEINAQLDDALLGAGAGNYWRSLKAPLGAKYLKDLSANLVNKRTGFAELGGLGDSGLAKGAGRLFGFAGIGSDIATMVAPGSHSLGEDIANRGMAFGNAMGTGAVMLGADGTAALATAAGIDAAVGWVPVAGQAVMIGTGLYLAGDWAYNHVKAFHNFVNSTGHALSSAGHDAAHFITHDIFGAL